MEGIGNGIPTEDKLILRGLKFHGFHGVKPKEKKTRSEFFGGCRCLDGSSGSRKSNNLSDTVSYTDIY
ncbi:hypothetical protein Godav_024194, partial [Gossypium davidsonii]|nr:hypothetical protein [Gossypium davidsonii]